MDATGGRGPRSARARQLGRLGGVLAIVGICAALPWVFPSVPALVAHGAPATVVPAQHPTDPRTRSSAAVVRPVGRPGGSDASADARRRTASRPLELQIPRLQVRSTVIPISGRSGTLEPPADPQQLGWWQEGPEVGALSGSAVVAGHSVHTGGGAFDHLGELVAGDQVRVRTAAGWIGYQVEDVEVISAAELARRSTEIFRGDGAGRLVLITCDDWDGSRFTSNALVYAVPVSDEPDDVRPD